MCSNCIPDYSGTSEKKYAEAAALQNRLKPSSRMAENTASGVQVFGDGGKYSPSKSVQILESGENNNCLRSSGYWSRPKIATVSGRPNTGVGEY